MLKIAILDYRALKVSESLVKLSLRIPFVIFTFPGNWGQYGYSRLLSDTGLHGCLVTAPEKLVPCH